MEDVVRSPKVEREADPRADSVIVVLRAGDTERLYVMFENALEERLKTLVQIKLSSEWDDCIGLKMDALHRPDQSLPQRSMPS